MSAENERVNEIVIRLHAEIEDASRTLGKVRRYGESQTKLRRVNACRVRLIAILAQLTTLEKVMSAENERVNEIVIRLHRELEDASRTLGKVRRYGEPQTKLRLVNACRVRLIAILAQLTTLENQYAEAEKTNNRSTVGSRSYNEQDRGPAAVAPDRSGPPDAGESEGVEPPTPAPENAE